jgi:5'(3')-deoxyribonucleotidase
MAKLSTSGQNCISAMLPVASRTYEKTMIIFRDEYFAFLTLLVQLFPFALSQIFLHPKNKNIVHVRYLLEAGPTVF